LALTIAALPAFSGAGRAALSFAASCPALSSCSRMRGFSGAITAAARAYNF